MVDEDRVARLLRGVSERCNRLDEAAAAPPSPVAGSLWLDGVKYLLVTAVGGCVDVAHHVAAAEGWAAPDTNASAVRRLGEHGVLDAVLAERLARAVGFRNVLVHQYAEVVDEIVLERLGDLGDLRLFVAQVSVWLLRRS